MVFVDVLVWNRVSISTILVWNGVWFVHSSLELNMFFRRISYFFIIWRYDHFPFHVYANYWSKPRMFCEERLNLELFQNMSVNEFYYLKALITLEQVNTTEWLKKIRILISKIAMVGCCKLSLNANGSCDEHAIYFRRWLKWRAT